MKTVQGPVLLVGKTLLTYDLIIEGDLYVVQPGSRLPDGLTRVDIENNDEDITIHGAAYLDSDCDLTHDLSTTFSYFNFNTYGPDSRD